MITSAIGTYSNAAHTLTYAWTSAQAVLIVGSTPPAPGGVLPSVSVGGLWAENAYDMAALVAANPHAKIVDAYTGDGGLPAGARVSGVLLCAGDSVIAEETPEADSQSIIPQDRAVLAN